MDLVRNLKRKKLKTRKCLNNLRKRLFGESDKAIIKDSNSVVNKNGSEEYFNTKPNSIKKSRLTSPLLNKAVQSETITRHTLSSIQEKTGIFKNVNDTSKMIFNECVSSLQRPSISSDTSYNMIKNPFTEIITSNNNYSFYNAPSKSPSLFSSLKSDRTMVSSVEESAYDSVENLHISSPKGLKKERKGFENDHFGKLSSKIVVEENPTTYIKLGYVKHAAAVHGGALTTSISRSSSPLSISDTSHVFSVCVDDTPEYIYYPHRLNQS